MKAEPIFQAIDALRQFGGNFRFVIPSPQGIPLTQTLAQELCQEHHSLVFICGHNEGIDERVRSGLGAQEIPRELFRSHLDRWCRQPGRNGSWSELSPATPEVDAC